MRDVGNSGTSCHALHPSLGFVLGSLDQGTCKLSALALASSTTFSWKPSYICLHYPPYIPDTFSQRTSTLHLTSALTFHQIWGALLRVFKAGLLSFLIRRWSSYRHRMANVGKNHITIADNGIRLMLDWMHWINNRICVKYLFGCIQRQLFDSLWLKHAMLQIYCM